MYITVQTFGKLHGSKPLAIDRIVKLVKEPDNKYDAEAIACEMRYFGKIGYVSNSVNTVAKGTMSAGRLYDKIGDEYVAKVKFIIGSEAIAKVLDSEEFVHEAEDPESDMHYLFEKLDGLELKE